MQYHPQQQRYTKLYFLFGSNKTTTKKENEDLYKPMWYVNVRVRVPDSAIVNPCETQGEDVGVKAKIQEREWQDKRRIQTLTHNT